MGFHVFGRVSAPTVMLLHGAYTTWELSFGAVIPLLAERFRVIAYGTSGFDPTESTEFSNARAEAERICHYTRVELDGHLTAIYASSLGCHPATYAALDPRTTVGTVILDGPVYMNTGRLTPITSRLERPTARLLASPRAQSVLQRLRGQPDPQSKSANLIYTEASVRSFENTAWSNVAWLADLRTLEPSPAANVHCWYGSRERKGVRRSITLLTRVFPGMRVREFQDFGHGALLHQPELLSSEIGELVTATAEEA